jgi:hypothetical protein
VNHRGHRVDEELTIQRSNAWASFIMYDVSQSKCRAFVHHEVRGIVAKWRACLATGEKFGYETGVRGADGEYRWKLPCKVALRDGCGNNFQVNDLVVSFGLTIGRTQLLIAIRREPLNLTCFGAIGRNAQCA